MRVSLCVHFHASDKHYSIYGMLGLLQVTTNYSNLTCKQTDFRHPCNNIHNELDGLAVNGCPGHMLSFDMPIVKMGAMEAGANAVRENRA